jgi:F-type H+-transporting ATPase subunit delta
MPLLESAPNTVSITYARSAFAVIQAKAGGSGREALQRTLDELHAVLDLARQDRRFNEFLSSRIIANPRRAKSLERLFRGRLADHTLNILLVLTGNDRLRLLPGVVQAFDRLFQEAFGRVEVGVVTASPMSDQQRAELSSRLQSKLGREPVITASVDPSLLGGIRIQIGDTLIDNSLAARLRGVSHQVVTGGLPRVRAGVERLVSAEG